MDNLQRKMMSSPRLLSIRWICQLPMPLDTLLRNIAFTKHHGGHLQHVEYTQEDRLGVEGFDNLYFDLLPEIRYLRIQLSQFEPQDVIPKHRDRLQCLDITGCVGFKPTDISEIGKFPMLNTLRLRGVNLGPHFLTECVDINLLTSLKLVGCEQAEFLINSGSPLNLKYFEFSEQHIDDTSNLRLGTLLSEFISGIPSLHTCHILQTHDEESFPTSKSIAKALNGHTASLRNLCLHARMSQRDPYDYGLFVDDPRPPQSDLFSEVYATLNLDFLGISGVIVSGIYKAGSGANNAQQPSEK
ncbi:MAG: hypothetical protein MMC23_009916 [Stictis urceolatum]|nr:hypothetical protein [Stictis urceolata]